MTKQEEVIARKRQEIIEKQKTTELAKQVVAAQALSSADTSAKSIPERDCDSSVQTTATTDSEKPKNNFNNDGSFFENFKKITEAAAKKAEEEKQKQEREEAMKKAIEEGVNLAKLTSVVRSKFWAHPSHYKSNISLQ